MRLATSIIILLISFSCSWGELKFTVKDSNSFRCKKGNWDHIFRFSGNEGDDSCYYSNRLHSGHLDQNIAKMEAKECWKQMALMGLDRKKCCIMEKEGRLYLKGMPICR